MLRYSDIESRVVCTEEPTLLCSLRLWSHTKVLASVVVDKPTGLLAIEAGGRNDEVGHVEREETVAIETARIALRQHECFGDTPFGIDMTEIRTREETVVAAGTEYEPTGVGAPIVERLRILGIGPVHRTTLPCSEVEQIKVGFMMPDTELSVVGKRVAKETAVVGGTGEGYGLALSRGIDDDIYLVTKSACVRIKVDAAEVIVDGVEKPHPHPLPEGEGWTSYTEIERAAVGREDGIGLVDGVLLEQGRKDQLVFLDIIDLKVGGGVEDLDAVAVGTVEQLVR